MNGISKFTRELESLASSLVEDTLQQIEEMARDFEIDPDDVYRYLIRTEALSNQSLQLLGKLMLWEGTVPPMGRMSGAIPRLVVTTSASLFDREIRGRKNELAAMMGTLARANPDLPIAEVVARAREYLANEGRHIKHPYLLTLVNRIIGV